MGNYALGIAGIIVSVVLFLVGYRQTVGAKRERVANANQEVTKILVRRLVTEPQFKPSPLDVTRLIGGKATDSRVRPSDMMSELQQLTVVFTRIAESDLIANAQRDDLLNRIEPALAAIEQAPADEASVVDLASYRRRLRMNTAALMTMGVAVSALGALVAAIPELRTVNPQLSQLAPTLIATMVGSLAAITALLAVYRLRNSQEDTSAGSEYARYADFELQVANTLTSFKGAEVRAGGRDDGYDFLTLIGRRRFVVEVKVWPPSVPTQVIRATTRRLREAASRTEADSAYVVTPAPIRIPDAVAADDSVRVITLRELKNVLANTRA